MSCFSVPSPANDYLAEHVGRLLRSYRELTGRYLITPNEDSMDPIELARRVNEAPFFVASHDTAGDPVLDYGNRCALKLFAMDWEQFTSTPSRFTAEAPNREERETLLRRVCEHGYIDNYSGVRIASDGRRFKISQASVWNLTDEQGEKCGQAATFSEWAYLPNP